MVLGLAAVSIAMSVIMWMFLEGQYLPVEWRGDALVRAVMLNPRVLAPGLLMASLVAGALALVRFWFAGVALRLSGRGQGERTRSPWMALGGGILALINVAGSATTLVLVFWKRLFG
jgi:hypothetical protein